MHKPAAFAIALTLVLSMLPLSADAAYKAVEHRTTLADGEIAVTEAGVCDQPGKTYVLMNDITSPASGLFLASNVTLDLNGYTLTYAAGDYQHVPNYSFEEGLDGWNVTDAPGAKVRDTSMLHPLHGKMTCLLPKGQEIASPYIDLPVANRTYFAMAMIANPKTPITVSMDDENGKAIRCVFKFGNNTRVTCPTVNGQTRIGGGVVYAMIHGMPAGKYRVRVKAIEKDVVIDAVDIRPAVDCGIGIVGRVNPWAYYKCVLDGDGPPAFFDYRKPGSTTTPADGIPQVKSPCTVTIKNGVIANGTRTIQTKGIQCTAQQAKTIISNVKLVSSGINANAVGVLQGVMKDCRVEVDTPFIINRHTRAEVACRFAGSKPTVISNCEFIGGQGCLTINGNGGLVHDNLFAGRQTVTNHYSLSLDANGAKVYNNTFEPLQGSGIYLYRYRNNQVYDNVFKITAAPPNNEYSDQDYSTNAIRISDYNAPRSSTKGASGNKIYRNKFYITGKAHDGAHPRYKAVANALFVSVGAGPNSVYENEIVVRNENPGNRAAEAYAFYIGGSDEGGLYYNNKITSNVTPIWVACRYGRAGNVEMYNNTIIKSEQAEPFIPIFCGDATRWAKNVGFYSNKFVGLEPTVKFRDHIAHKSEVEFGWTLTIRTDPAAKVSVKDADGQTVLAGRADKNGVAIARLAQHKLNSKKGGQDKTDISLYTVTVGSRTQQVTMTSDQEITLTSAR